VGYAERTTVAPSRTRAAIEDELDKRGASAFGFNREGRSNIIAFTLNGLQVRLSLEMPDPDERRFVYTTQGRSRSPSAAADAYEQEVRRRWRALLLVLKAKLVAVDEGITTLEREFLADIMLASGVKVLEQIRPAIEETRQARLELEAP
jgi:hypothetical protein